MIHTLHSLFRIIPVVVFIDSIVCLPLGGTWRQVGTDITSNTPSDILGYSVAMSKDGKTVAIGAPFNDNINGTDAGVARVYSINSSLNTWTQVGLDIIGEGKDDTSGFSVSISADGKMVAVGAASNDNVNGPDSGHVRVYSFNPTVNNWVQIGSDINGKAAFDRSGYSIDMSANGTTIAIGAIYNNDGGASAGHVRVYSIVNSLSNIWTQVGSDIVGEDVDDNFGYSVSLSDDGRTLAIGAPSNDNANGLNVGHVRVYSLNSNSNNWVQVGQDIDGKAQDDIFGHSVSLSADGKTIAIGAPLNDNTNAGQVRVYSMNTSISSNWIQVGSDINGEPQDRAGWSVVLSADGKTVGIGATGYGNFAGQASVYTINSTTGNWVKIGVSINGAAASDSFGRSISMTADGTTIAIGSSNSYVRVVTYTLPTIAPTKSPTKRPTKSPTKQPTKSPTKRPTKSPTKAPSMIPTRSPAKSQTRQPTRPPTTVPSKKPTKFPTKIPSKLPTKSPIYAPQQITIPLPISIPVEVPDESPVDALTNCGIFGWNIFCPRRWNCGFWRRLFQIHGC